MANLFFFLSKKTESDTTLASLNPFSLYLSIILAKSSLYLLLINLDGFNILIGFICLVLLINFLSFLSENFSLPSNTILSILIFSPLSIFTTILTLFPEVVSATVLIATLVLK